MRFDLIVLTALTLIAGPAAVARDATLPPSATEPQIELTESIDLGRDRTERMTVPVRIDGQGPYEFIVDTGAERTVIARELARDLGLQAGPNAIVYSMTEASRVNTVVIPKLELGRRTVTDIRAPALEQHHLGAAGLLGIDTLATQRVELDFVRGEMTVSPSPPTEERWPGETIVVTGRSRYGQLVLVDAQFEGERVYVIIDTGAQVTVANNALRRRLERRGRLGTLQPVQIVGVTGGVIQVDYGVARRIRIGGAEIRSLPVAFADARPFRQMQLENHPAILLGMDALRLFDRVSIDFANRRVRLLLRDTSAATPPVRFASRPIFVPLAP